MKNSIYFILFCILFSCSKKQEAVSETPLIHTKYFSVSENDRKLDSMSNEIKASDSLQTLIDPTELNPNHNYDIGGIHFLVKDSSQSYYVINYLEHQMNCVSDILPYSKEDSLCFVQKSISKIKKANPIPTKQIITILEKNKTTIHKNNRFIPITFALEKDTIQGNAIFNIINYMENNKMEIYKFRAMNKEELEITSQK